MIAATGKSTMWSGSGARLGPYEVVGALGAAGERHVRFVEALR